MACPFFLPFTAHPPLLGRLRRGLPLLQVAAFIVASAVVIGFLAGLYGGHVVQQFPFSLASLGLSLARANVLEGGSCIKFLFFRIITSSFIRAFVFNKVSFHQLFKIPFSGCFTFSYMSSYSRFLYSWIILNNLKNIF